MRSSPAGSGGKSSFSLTTCGCLAGFCRVSCVEKSENSATRVRGYTALRKRRRLTTKNHIPAYILCISCCTAAELDVNASLFGDQRDRRVLFRKLFFHQLEELCNRRGDTQILVALPLKNPFRAFVIYFPLPPNHVHMNNKLEISNAPLRLVHKSSWS